MGVTTCARKALTCLALLYLFSTIAFDLTSSHIAYIRNSVVMLRGRPLSFEIYLHTHTRMYTHTHVHTYTYTHAHTHTHTHTRTHTLTHTPLYAYFSKRGDVEYSLRAIPLGGYVAFPDEKDPNNKYKSGRCLLDSWVAFMTNKSVLYDDVKHSKTAHRMTSAVCCLSACQRSFICPPSFLSCAYSHPTDDPDLLENCSMTTLLHSPTLFSHLCILPPHR